MLHAQRERRVVKLSNELWRAMQHYVVENFSSNHFSVGAFLAQHFKSGSPMADHVYPFPPPPTLWLWSDDAFIFRLLVFLNSLPPSAVSCGNMVPTARSTILPSEAHNSSESHPMCTFLLEAYSSFLLAVQEVLCGSGSFFSGALGVDQQDRE